MNSSRQTPLLLNRTRAALSLRLIACSSILVLAIAGCHSNPPADDATLTRNVQSSLSGDSALSGLGIQGGVQGGVATLTGNVQNDAQRSLAARDASAIQGIHEVVNNISVIPANPAPIHSADVVTPPPAAIPAPIQNTTGQLRPQDTRRQRELDRQRAAQDRRQQQQQRQQRPQDNQPAPIERAQNAPAPQPVYNPPAPRHATPPQPVFRDIIIPAGYAIAVRVTQTLDSADAQQGQSFSGVVANDVMADGMVAIPAGTHVAGQIDAVQEAAHFKGNSLLTVSLTSVSSRGERVPVSTEPYTVEGKGRGKNTLEKTGGGAAVGAILGGIFGGGKGAAIGAATGGGLGAGSNAITRGQQVQIPSESIVRFRLTQSIPLHLRVDGQNHVDGQSNDSPAIRDPALQHHPQ